MSFISAFLIKLYCLRFPLFMFFSFLAYILEDLDKPHIFCWTNGENYTNHVFGWFCRNCQIQMLAGTYSMPESEFFAFHNFVD